MLTQTVLESFGYPMTPGDAVRRVFEAISSGILLSSKYTVFSSFPNLFIFSITERAILYDPCEKEKTDVMEPLTPQQREDITSSAQHALRLIIFDQMHKILDMERIENTTLSKENRKRPYDHTENGRF